MASQTAASSQDSFAKAFVPGLVLGLIIGAVLGAVVPPFFESSPKVMKRDPGAVVDSGPRDESRGRIEDPELLGDTLPEDAELDKALDEVIDEETPPDDG